MLSVIVTGIHSVTRPKGAKEGQRPENPSELPPVATEQKKALVLVSAQRIPGRLAPSRPTNSRINPIFEILFLLMANSPEI